MIHYVALPIELVVENMDKTDYNFIEVEIDGDKMIMEPINLINGELLSDQF